MKNRASFGQRTGGDFRAALPGSIPTQKAEATRKVRALASQQKKKTVQDRGQTAFLKTKLRMMASAREFADHSKEPLFIETFHQEFPHYFAVLRDKLDCPIDYEVFAKLADRDPRSVDVLNWYLFFQRYWDRLIGEPAPTTSPGQNKGDRKLLEGKPAVAFRTAEAYLGISERQRQSLVKDEVLIVEGGGHNRKITTESLIQYLKPEKPK